jgi:hypothetical protein
VYLLEVFYREEDETDSFDPYSAELNENDKQEGTANNEKRQQPEEQYNAKERGSALNVSGSNSFHIHNRFMSFSFLIFVDI